MSLKHGPHKIPQDEKYLSRDDIETSTKKKAGGQKVPNEGDGVLSDDGSDTLLSCSKSSTLSSKKSSKGKLDPDKLDENDYVPKDVQVIDWINEQKSPRRYRWHWILILVILFSLAILIPVLIIKLHKENGVAVGPANSTATTTVYETTTATPSATTVVITQTPATTTVIIESSSSPTSSPSPLPVIPNEGFHAKSFQNGDLQLFYADGNGNIMSIQHVLGSWSSPVAIAKDAKTGTTISASAIYYHDTEDDDTDETCKDSVTWRLFYVDENDILQELWNDIVFDPEDFDDCTNTDSHELSGLYNSDMWTSGPLGFSKLKTSGSLYQTSCTPYQSLNFTWSADGLDLYYNYTSGTNIVYLYYGSDSGEIAKIAYDNYNGKWSYVSNTPSIEYASSQAIECTARSDGIESIWAATQNGTIQQWWTDTTAATTLWNAGITYTGNISPNSSLHSISSANLSTVYFQAPNNSIMQLSITSGANGTSSMSVTEVGVGSSGTRLMTDGSENDAFYYLYFQNRSQLVQTLMHRNSSSGLAAADGTTTLPTIAFAGVGKLMFSPVLCSLCFGLVLCLLL